MCEFCWDLLPTRDVLFNLEPRAFCFGCITAIKIFGSQQDSLVDFWSDWVYSVAVG